jgi:hypothetical protein
MSTKTAVVDARTNLFSLDGRVPAEFRRVVPVPRSPNPSVEKFSGDESAPFVALTAADLAAESAAAVASVQADAALTSRQKDQLASAARRLMLTNPTSWNSATLNQKKAAVLAEADAWRDIRVWIEQNMK